MKKKWMKPARKMAMRMAMRIGKKKLGLNRNKHDWTSDVIMAISGFAFGALLMFIFDPGRGRTRRKLAGDQVVHLKHKASDQISGVSKDLQNRAKGVAAVTSSRVSDLSDQLSTKAGAITSKLGSMSGSQSGQDDSGTQNVAEQNLRQIHAADQTPIPQPNSDFIQPGTIPTNETIEYASDMVGQNPGSTIVMSRIIDTHEPDSTESGTIPAEELRNEELNRDFSEQPPLLENAPLKSEYHVAPTAGQLPQNQPGMTGEMLNREDTPVSGERNQDIPLRKLPTDSGSTPTSGMDREV